MRGMVGVCESCIHVFRSNVHFVEIASGVASVMRAGYRRRGFRGCAPLVSCHDDSPLLIAPTGAFASLPCVGAADTI